MKLSLATSIMLYRLVRGFAFTPSPSLNGSLRPILRTGEGESRTTPQQRRYTSGTDLTTSSMRTSSTRRPSAHVSKMVIRPDWEREGKAFGMEPPSKKTGERAFEYLVDYPCEFEIKVIGINEGSFADDIAATVSTACQVEAEDVRFTVRDTSSGRYQSVSVHAPVKSANMLYRCYELIDEDPRVKFKF